MDLNDDAVVKDEIERLDDKIGLALFEDVADDDEDMVWSFLKRFEGGEGTRGSESKAGSSVEESDGYPFLPKNSG